MNRSYQTILNDAVRQHVSENLSLYPDIAARLENKPFQNTLNAFRARPAISIFIMIVAISLLTSAVYAVGRSIGYIPGIGIVEQDSPIRVLTQSAASERDGITLTVSDAVLTSDKTVILYSLENVPWDIFSHQEDLSGCIAMPELLLPDGGRLVSREGGGSPLQMRMVYPPLPADVKEVVFILPCIMNSLPGLAPENWEIPLRFEPAPPDIPILPALEITPLPTPSGTTEQNIPVELNNSLLINDQYILTGIINQPELGARIELLDFRVTDASGEQVYTQMPGFLDLPSFDWGMQFPAGEVDFPLTLEFDWIQISQMDSSSAVFEFDVGENPLPGQEWIVDQPIQIGERTITLNSIRTDSRSGYNFIFSADPDLIGLSLQIPGADALGGGGGYGQGWFSVSQSFTDLPRGTLRIVLSNLLVASPPETQSISWSPENLPSDQVFQTDPDSGGCLSLAGWSELIEGNDLPVPGDLGKIVQTVNEGGRLPAIYTSNPDGTDRQKVAVGAWPSLSNDGSRLAYSAGDGLHVHDLSSGIDTSLGIDGYHFIWSPDDTHLLYTTTFNLYTVTVDGSEIERLSTEPGQVLSPVGWLPDNQGVYYSILTGSGFDLLRYNWQSAETLTLFPINNKAGYADLSPDGQWIVFADRVSAEEVNWSIFVSRPDGSERRMIVESAVPTAFNAVWGPDGNWLIINTQSADGNQIPVVINPFTCQTAVIPINGSVEGWSW